MDEFKVKNSGNLSRCVIKNKISDNLTKMILKNYKLVEKGKDTKILEC